VTRNTPLFKTSDSGNHEESRRATPLVSLAVPVFNEEALIPELLRRTLAVLDQLPGGPHELILVDDGSRDATFDRLRDAALQDPRVTVLSFSRNFGHQLALTAALDAATGDVVVLMDGDLQDRPESIPTFLDYYHRGYEVVYAIRGKRKENWLLRACYSLFYRTLNSVAEMKLPLDSGDFCLMSRAVVDVLTHSRERHRYLRGLRAWAGFRQIGVEVERDARFAGMPKFTLRKLIRLASDGFVSFSVAPLRFAGIVGFATVVLSLLLAVFFVTAKILGFAPQGFSALAVSISFFAGVQLLCLGVIGEYVGRIYEEVKQRPLYVIGQVVRNQDQWMPVTSPTIENSTNSIGGGAAGRKSSAGHWTAGLPEIPHRSSSISAVATD